MQLEKASLSESDILRLCFNRLISYDKYSLGNSQNLTQPIQM